MTKSFFEMNSDVKQVLNWSQFEYRQQQFLNKGIIFLQEEIDEVTSAEFIEKFIYLSKIAPPMDGDVKKPLWIILKSVGGDVFDGLGIHDLIHAAAVSGTEVNIVGIGLVASMALGIIQAGSRRFALPNTQFLLHEISQVTVASERASEVEERAAENKRMNRVVMGVIAKRMAIDLDELIAISKKKDCWYNVEDAKKLGTNGLIDEIIETLPF